MDFRDIYGQDNIKRALEDALYDGRLGHAYIFEGEKGLGKKMMAKIFASKILCSRESKDKCSCNNCQMFFLGVHPDYFVVERDGGSIGVDKIRKLEAQLIMKPTYGDKKVFVIEDADTMTPDAQNALLKTLEEPPEYVVIILCSNNYSMMLDTIKSRAVKYSFKKNSRKDIEEYLRQRDKNLDEDREFLISYADGNIGNLIKLLEDEELTTLRNVVMGYALDIKKMNRSEIIKARDFLAENKNNVEYMLVTIMTVYRDILIMKLTGDKNFLTNADKRDIIKIRQDEFRQDELVRDIEIIERTIEYIKRNANFGLSIEVMFSKMQEEM